MILEERKKNSFYFISKSLKQIITMNNQEIVAKLWALCNVLRDDGITYHQYVTELTYILFLKMAKETNSEAEIPEM